MKFCMPLCHTHALFAVLKPPVGYWEGWTVTVLYLYMLGYGTVDMRWSIAKLLLLVAADISMELMEFGALNCAVNCAVNCLCLKK